MKKIILASLLMMSVSAAFAQTNDGIACDGTGTASAAVVTGATDNTRYIRSTFKPVCSNNSHVVYTDDLTNQKLFAGSASVKGSGYFGGSTLGGSIQRAGDCPAKACGSVAGTQAEAGRTAANAYGAST